MKVSGIVRKVDELGRVVLPIEMRRLLGIEEKDPLEIYVDGDTIILRKSTNNCVFCGSGEGLVEFEKRYICPECRKRIHRLAD